MTATISTSFIHALLGFRITAGPDENLGVGIRLVDDFNGDGLADVVMSGALQDTTDTVVLFGSASPGAGGQVDLSILAAADGFRIDLDGNGNIRSGLGAGDVNGDGLTDLLLTADANGDAFALFGGSDLIFGSLSMATLDGSDGFEIVDSGVTSSFQFGEANGDFNGDGFNDIVVADLTDPRITSVVFGGAEFGPDFDVAGLDGTDGFRVGSLDVNLAVGDFIGDFNGDGFDDLIVWEGGVSNASGSQGAGAIVFGGQAPPALSVIDDLDEPGVGLRLEASNVRDYTAVGIGDVNGDGFADVFIGDAAVQGDGGGVVVFGRNESGVVIDFDDLDGTDGFRVNAPAGANLNVNDFNNVSRAGDFNGDGVDDFVIGARALSNANVAGQAYVIFGRASGFASTLDLDDMAFDEGFQIVNDAGGQLGVTVSGGADVNGDGFDDIALGGGVNAQGLSEQTILFGRDFSGGAIVGGDGADSETGTAAADRIVGGRGDDVLTGGGGQDALSGGAGDDVLIVGDASFRRVDGGTGDDILRIPGDAGMTLDFTGIGSLGIESIETIDLCGAEGNFLKLRPVDVANLSESTNKLFVTGGAADAVTLVGATVNPFSGDPDTFAFVGTETVDGVVFDRYVAGARTISIQQGVGVRREVSIGDLADESIRFLEADGQRGGFDAAFGIGTSGTLGADLNGDGFSDVLIGGPGPVNGAGIVFDIRSEELPAAGDVDLGGENNFSFDDGHGAVVTSVGDVNGDGFGDYVQTQPNDDSNVGYASIEFGNAGAGLTAAYTAINGEAGSEGRFGFDASGGGGVDFNGDGVADFIIGAPFFDGAAGVQSGRAYVIFGEVGDPADFNVDPGDLDGADGVLLDGPNAGNRFGQGVAALGDVNGDGLNDFAIAEPFVDVGSVDSGAVYVVFGQVGGFGPTFDVRDLNGSNGFRIAGDSGVPTHRLGHVRNAGDVNSDGFDDILLTGFSTFARHVVFGGQNFFGDVALANLDGSDGFEISGFTGGQGSAGIGDFNGDGVDDLLLDDSQASSGGLIQNGRASVLFGDRDGFAANIDVNELTESEGFSIVGDRDGLRFGVGGREPGDVNGDGFFDLLIGAPGGGAIEGAGESHLIFGAGDVFAFDDDIGKGLNGNSASNILFGAGGDDVQRGGNGDDTLNGGTGDDILIGQGDDDILIGGVGDDRLNGGAGADVMRGGAGDDIYEVDNVNDIVREKFGEGLDRINTTVDFTNPGNVEFLVAAPSAQGLTLIGSVFRDQITGANRISIGDSISGNGGNDLLVGRVGNDSLSGGDGDDRLFGNSGDDFLVGGVGNDVMTGQQGADSFLFVEDHGRDSITDFATGIDTLIVGAVFTEFAEVLAATEDVNGNARITFTPGNFVTLIGVAEAELSAGDFDFSPV